ncbi:MAG: diaminopimelate epimerase [Vulcanimicrobiaceae bacterium]
MTFVPVTKMHGTRNDFVLVDERTARIANYPEFARLVCDRHAGIGADGILLVLMSQSADARMQIFNADGSEAEMCGNGMRCFARYLHDMGGPSDLRVETRAGVIETSIMSGPPNVTVRVAMGIPKFTKRETLSSDIIFVDMGNPHVVLFAKGLDDIELDEVGPKYNAQEPGGINVHVAVKAGPSRLLVRHWERGVGKTMACGTGAVAAAAAAIQRGDVQSPVEVNVPGGRLVVEWDGSNAATLAGPAARVFDTKIDISDALLVPK